MRPGKRKLLDPDCEVDAWTEQLEHIKARIRAKVEHPFRVIKRQFGHVKVRYRGLAKNTAQLHTLFALSNIWMARRRWMAVGGDECVCNALDRPSSEDFRALRPVGWPIRQPIWSGKR
ncbi:MAG: hypothetical protein RL223_905 [Pseudomonadota bacterium]|jgi:IS5 family transposase